MKLEHIPENWHVEKRGRAFAFFDENGMQRCGAKTRRGTACRKSPVEGRNRCRLHFGNMPRGAAHPSYKNGHYSGYMPRHLGEIYERWRGDPELMDLRRTAATQQAFIEDELERLGEKPDSAKAWDEVLDAIDDHEAAVASGNADEFRESMQGLHDLRQTAGRMKHWYASRASILDMLDAQRKTITDHHRIEAQSDRVLTVTEVVTLISGIIHVIDRIVPDQSLKYELAERIENLITLPNNAVEAGEASE